ncbi:MAG: YdeI/OmpD-associated family protein [Chthonomonadales bacterium]
MAQEFRTNLSGTATGPTGIKVPSEIIEQLGSGKKPPVVVSVNGYEYRSTVAVMGGAFMIPFSSEHRSKSGIGAGDSITVTLSLDEKPRTVEIPDDLALALNTAGKSVAFEKLAPSRKKEYVRQVTEAKAAETRLRRIEKIATEI